MCVNTIMLSSLKSTALLLLLLLIATVFSLGAAKNLRYKHEITTIATEAETLQPTTTTPKPPTTVKTTTTTTTKLLQSRPPSQQNIVDCGKSGNYLKRLYLRKTFQIICIYRDLQRLNGDEVLVLKFLSETSNSCLLFYEKVSKTVLIGWIQFSEWVLKRPKRNFSLQRKN